MAPRRLISEGTAQLVVPPFISGTKFGQVQVTLAGTPVQGGDVAADTGFNLKAHPDNKDTIWIFGASQTKANGFPLNPGESDFVAVSNLNQLFFDADQTNDKVCWQKA